MNYIYKTYTNWIVALSQVNPFNLKLGITRSILALSTLFTLVFNSNDVIFPKYGFETLKLNSLLYKVNYFTLFGGFEYIQTSKIIAILILIWVITGFYPRFSAILHWWICISFITLAPIVDGGDNINSNISFLIMLIMIFDKRTNHWKETKVNNNKFNYVNVFCNSIVLLICLQISIIYFHASFGKLLVEEWRYGTAFYYYFNGDVFSGGALKKYINPLLFNPVVVMAISWGTIIFELLLSLLLFSNDNKLKQIFFIFAVIFHFLIVIIFGLGSFFLSMTACLTIYLLNNDKILAIFKNKVCTTKNKKYIGLLP